MDRNYDTGDVEADFVLTHLQAKAFKRETGKYGAGKVRFMQDKIL